MPLFPQSKNFDLIKECGDRAREAVLIHYGLPDDSDFASYCEECAEAVFEELEKSGIKSQVICSLYSYGFSDLDLEPECNTHCWVDTGDWIIDISRMQFSHTRKVLDASKDLYVKKGSGDAKHYIYDSLYLSVLKSN